MNPLLQAQNPNCVVLVDNCYGEFVEEREPPSVVSEWVGERE